MTVVGDIHEDNGATFGEFGGRRTPLHYGRPEREHLAVRRVVGVTEPAYGVVAVEGEGRREALGGILTATPREERTGTYALCPDGEGGIAADAVVLDAGDRLLCFVPPDRTDALVGRVDATGVTARDATAEFAVFGVHGPKATEKVASVLHGGTPPEERLSFVRGSLEDVGASVVRTEAPAGEEGYEVVCGADGADPVYETLLSRGLNAAPFGFSAWETLTLEAGTPLYGSELASLSPAALSGEDSPHRLVGLAPGEVPPAGASVVADGEAVGRVTRAAESPVLEEPIAMAVVESGGERGELGVEVDGTVVGAERRSLPFVEGSERSGRLPPG
jgi:aminomethyltransferase